MADFRFEAELAGPVAGIDEAGRGPWAGPVVAAAVILDRGAAPRGLADSKTLSPTRRERLFEALQAGPHAIGVGIVSAADIDRLNILQATFLAMTRALAGLPVSPRIALVDGNRVPPLPCAARPVVQGDRLSASIAAASIVAKVTRDRIMQEMDRQYPEYGFAQHKGYGVASHAEALREHGPCAEHRRSFRPVRALLPAQGVVGTTPATYR